MEYDVGCFTNFSQDHLDYFQTMDRYFETKKSFITGGQVRNATLNADDDAVAAIRNEMTIPNITYGISANSDLYARDIEISENGVDFKMSLHGAHDIKMSNMSEPLTFFKHDVHAHTGTPPQNAEYRIRCIRFCSHASLLRGHLFLFPATKMLS